MKSCGLRRDEKEKREMNARASVRSNRRPVSDRASSPARGFTMLELTISMGIVAVMTAIAVPVVKSSLNAYRLSSAVSSVTGAVQTTRYRAISTGYPFQVVFTAATSRYQILSDPTDTGAFANVGNPIVFSAVPNMLNQNTTITFRPGGALASPQALANGNTPMTLTYSNAIPELITVSPYGRINVTP
jgi:prepilin-type N-terminal cleavage/methylation domain-containing protein